MPVACRPNNLTTLLTSSSGLLRSRWFGQGVERAAVLFRYVVAVHV